MLKYFIASVCTLIKYPAAQRIPISIRTRFSWRKTLFNKGVGRWGRGALEIKIRGVGAPEKFADPPPYFLNGIALLYAKKNLCL